MALTIKFQIGSGSRYQRRLEEILHKVKGVKKVRVGFLENAKYPDGTQVALIAAIQDFGAPSRNIPPRPFFRNMVKDKSPEWSKAIANLLKANNYDARKTLDQTGQAIVGQLKDSIIEGAWVANAPSTVKQKGFDKPLIDTSHLLNSVDYEVKT